MFQDSERLSLRQLKLHCQPENRVFSRRSTQHNLSALYCAAIGTVPFTFLALTAVVEKLKKFIDQDSFTAPWRMPLEWTSANPAIKSLY